MLILKYVHIKNLAYIILFFFNNSTTPEPTVPYPKTAVLIMFIPSQFFSSIRFRPRQRHYFDIMNIIPENVSVARIFSPDPKVVCLLVYFYEICLAVQKMTKPLKCAQQYLFVYYIIGVFDMQEEGGKFSIKFNYPQKETAFWFWFCCLL